VFTNGDIGYYWVIKAAENSYAKFFLFDDIYKADVTSSERGQGYSCRCVKD